MKAVFYGIFKHSCIRELMLVENGRMEHWDIFIIINHAWNSNKKVALVMKTSIKQLSVFANFLCTRHHVKVLH